MNRVSFKASELKIGTFSITIAGSVSGGASHSKTFSITTRCGLLSGDADYLGSDFSSVY